MTEADLPRASALSAAVGWNQNEADWQIFLANGAVQVMDDGHADLLAASAAVLRFGPELAWISMVLVRPDLRRRGLATELMRWAIAALEGTRCIALDATPAGREVYRRLGFENRFGFTRWRVRASPAPAHRLVRPMRDSDWPMLLARDAAAFGAPRRALLQNFAARLPEACWVAEDGSGYALGRDGLRAPQIGPVVAAHPATADALIAAASHALGTPALLDLADSASELGSRIEEAGAERLRPFTRMTRGAPLPGDPRQLVAMGGPEFG